MRQCVKNIDDLIYRILYSVQVIRYEVTSTF